MKRKLLIGITLVFSVIALNIYASPEDEKLEKEYQESFQVNEDAKLVVENKFGDVFLTSWDKNEIKIDAIVTVESNSNSSKVSRFFEGIEVKITGNENLVSAITDMPSFKSSGKINISVDYHISLPETIELDIDHVYGNVVLKNNWVGPTKFEVKYGNLQVRDLANRDNIIDIKYGELFIENITNSRISVAYSEAYIESANQLELKTSYGEVELGVVGSLDLKTAFDEIEIKEVTDLYARSDYSEIDIAKLKNSLEIDLDFGEMSVDYIAQGFKFIKIDSDNASVDLEMDESASYEFEVVTRYGDFYVKNERSFSKEKISFNSYRYIGKVGSSANAGELIIDSSYASIEIK